MKKERRRAVHAELVRESRDNPGYYRYNITIREKDGKEHVVPAYGVDMQDAIERLIWVERVDKLNKSKILIPFFSILILGIIAFFGVVSVIQDNPLWIFAGIILTAIILSSTSLIDAYLKRK